MWDPVHGAVAIMGGLLFAALIVAITRMIVLRRLHHKRAAGALQPASQLPPPLDEEEQAEADDDEYAIAASAIRVEAALVDAVTVPLEDEKWDDEYAWPANPEDDDFAPADDNMLADIRKEAMASVATDGKVSSAAVDGPQVLEASAGRPRRKRKTKHSLNKPTGCRCESAGALSKISGTSSTQSVHAQVCQSTIGKGDASASPHGACATRKNDDVLEGERHLDPLEA